MQSADKTFDEKALKQLFQKSGDVVFQEYTFNQQKVMFITCDAMTDQQLFNNVIIERIQLFFNSFEELSFEEAITTHLHIPALTKMENENDILTAVYTGNVLIYFEDYQALYASSISSKPNRSIEQTTTEVTVKGPRDNFIEDLSTNIALIRKRLPTNSFCVEKFILGRRTKTTVAILYFDDVADQEILEGLKKKINEIDVDLIYSGDVLMEMIDTRSVLLPRHDYTGRPDYAMQHLARGRFVILIDGVAYGVIVPINLFFLFKTNEDLDVSVAASSFERVVRLVALLIGVFLPAFWLALTTYHQNQLPLLLLATIVSSRTGLPLPSALEMTLMVFMFELFREFGMRLPAAIGGTISVVGGLIIGDAAIRAGITSPAMVVIIATSVIASYTLVNQSLVSAVSIARFCIIIFVSFFGLFGFLISFLFLVFYLANVRTFGVPYLPFAADLSWSTLMRTIIRPKEKYYAERPHEMNPKDKKRMNNEKK